MKRIAMKTVNYLPDCPFTYNSNNQKVPGTKETTYDEFRMTCTLFDFDGELACWVGLDVAGVSATMWEIFKEEMDKVVAIKPDHFYVSGTHTHSGPNFSDGPMFSHKESRDTMGQICFESAKKAAQLAGECLKELQPFTSDIRVTHIDGCYSNRNSLDGPCDKDFTLIRFKNADTGAVIGMWMNMSCHATMIYPKTEKMSTDLVGGINKKLSAHFGVQVMSTCGCQGDTSTRLTRNRTDSVENDLKELDRLVNGVADQVIADAAPFEEIAIDRFVAKRFSVTFDYPQDPQATEKRIENLEADIAAETNPDQIRIKKSARRAMEGQRGVTENHATIYNTALDLGEIKIGVFSGELVASLGLQVVRHQPHDHRLVICYTNDRGAGYLVERSEYGKNFESLSSIIPIGIPEVLTAMMVKQLDEYDLK